MPDVEMKPAADAEDKKENSAKDTEETTPPLPPSPLAEIKANVVLIERAISTLEPRFTHRVLRSLTALRRKLTPEIIRDAVQDLYPKDSASARVLLGWIPGTPSSGMEVDGTPASSVTPVPTSEPVPEVDVYLRLLLVHFLLTTGEVAKSRELVLETVKKMQLLNRRSMDPIAAKIWFAVQQIYEAEGKLEEARPLFLTAQRTAALRQDDESQASLINRLLHNYISYSLYDQADLLVSKTTFPQSAANPQIARYHYYLGRIRAVQLNYTEAHANLQQAIRRSPPAKLAPGFYQAAQKLFVLVELLMGEIPDRSTFRHPVLEKPLAAYFDVVKAVRSGSLSQFQATLTKHAGQFETDKTHTLVVRLRQNVIKTGIRRLSLAYSRISLREICVKLHLDSEEDAEYIVGKAIRDGVIDAKIVHEKGWMECGGQKSAYHGSEASNVFARRIGYCLELHNTSVKAMRYPLNAHKKELQDAEGAREREKELAKEIAEGEMEEDDEV
ncbi:PCI domain-containing protein [Flagelloscypha sp. PMI_526]|nr:PCI domain-containing protein [Flagelloscypha sp. PMI_526]